MIFTSSSSSRDHPFANSNLDTSGNLNFSHAGTTLVGGELRTCGGRVMAVSATAATLEQAIELAYEVVTMVRFEGMFYRKDIARR